MSKIPKSQWTEAEREFDRIICKTESKNQLTRIYGCQALKKFVAKHGKEECDRMWERIK